MSYRNVTHILPEELLAAIQNYIDGEYVYIPRKTENKQSWGSNSDFQKELALRNEKIYRDYLSGMSADALSGKYYLSVKSIQRIVLKEKRK